MSSYLSYSSRGGSGGGGGGVTSLDGQTGALTLVAGTGITITDGSGTITIASTGQPAGNYITDLTGDGTASGPGSAAFTLATVNSNVGTFGAASQVAVFTANAKGLITAAASTSILIAESQVTNLVSDLAGKQPTGSYITALTGDATASGPGSAALTLATVNSNVGSFGNGTSVATFTVNAKGLITAAASTSIQIAESQVTNLVSDLAGKQATGNYITALTGDVTATGPGSVASTVAKIQGVTVAGTSGTGNVAFTISPTFTGTVNLNATNNATGLRPSADLTYDLGAGTLRWNNLYTGQVRFNTSASANKGFIDMANWQLKDGNGIGSLDWHFRNLLDTSSVTQLTWSTSGINFPVLTASSLLYLNASKNASSITFGTTGQFFVSNGASTPPSFQTINVPIQTAIFNETQTSGTDGGTATSGSYQTRVLNTTQQSQSWASLSSNQITLTAGTYCIYASAPYNVGPTAGRHKAQFYNVTDAATAILGGSSYVGALTEDYAFVNGVITIAGTKTFELRHRVETTVSGNGFGVSASFGDSEIYSVVTITKQ